MTAPLDPTSPGWGHLADRVAVLTADLAEATIQADRWRVEARNDAVTIANLRDELARSRARADHWQREAATPVVGRAANLVAAAICDDCGNGRPVVDPVEGIGHVVQRGRHGPNDPVTVDSWAACEAEGLWQALERAHAVELRVLAEPDYEGRVET